MPVNASSGGKRQLSLGQILSPSASHIRDISPDYWFGPLQPIPSMAPDSYRIRQYAYTPGANLSWEPGDEKAVPYETLRRLADSWDILRIAIETRKDQLAAREWEIQLVPLPNESVKERRMREAKDDNIREITEFLRYPDGSRPFRQWFRMLHEDELVLDAVSLYLERNKNGKIGRLMPVDAATINRLFTDQGITPPPPSAAYQQVVYGTPARDLSTDDMIFSMRNERTFQRYGFSRVEQVILAINIGLRREQFQLEYYTAGSIPEGLLFMPPSVSPERIEEVQTWLDSVLSGDLARRRRLTLLPSFGAESSKPNVVFPKEPLLKDEMDEWLARIVCAAFGLSPQPFVKMMNRSSAIEASDSKIEESLEPDLAYWRSFMNRVLDAMGGNGQYRFVWSPYRDADVLKQAQTDSLLVGKILTINEIREARNFSPRPEPEADMLGEYTPATGFIPVDTDLGSIKAGTKPRKLAKESGRLTWPAAPEMPEDYPKQQMAASYGSDKAWTLHPSEMTDAKREAREKIKGAVHEWLKNARLDIVRTSQRAEKGKKSVKEWEEILWGLLLWERLTHGIHIGLLEAALHGSGDALQMSGMPGGRIVRDEVESAARARSAEISGLQWDGEQLVPSGGAERTIVPRTRKAIAELARKAAKQGYINGSDVDGTRAFSEERADLIADYEMSRMYREGALKTFEHTSAASRVRWVLSPAHPRMDECDENAAAGWMPIGHRFPTGVPAPPAHPLCMCSLEVMPSVDSYLL